MLESFFRKRVIGRLFVNLMLALILILSTSTSVWASTNDVLPEIRSLLQDQYADPVSQEVLNAPTIDEMLKRLGDPHTSYFTPAQYQDFVGSVNMSFVGIGIHIEMLPEGVKVDSVIQGSPAEEVGLKAGDIIIDADGQSLAGLSSDQAVNLLRGAEGSKVQISIKRGTEAMDFTVTRQAVAEPTVTGSVLDGHIGYIQLKSFGSNTPSEFANTAVQLNSQNVVDSWVVDLRDNGGGYLSSAIDLAGFFIGPDVAVQVRDRSGVLHLYQAPNQPFTLNQPIIFLTNENSASASEILTSAVKDYHKATIVGTTTYGKGTVQSMFNLSNGGVLKMTVEHFYSAFGHEINKVGITPDVEIQQTDSLKAAELLLTDKTVALNKARTQDYWESWRELSSSTATNVNPELYTLYYPDYQKVGELSSVPLDKKFTVHFDGAVDWHSVNDVSVELIDSQTGERTPTTFNILGPSDVQVIPEKALSPDTTYWLVAHPTILYTSGKALSKGTLTIVHTTQGPTAAGKAMVQSFNKPLRSISEGKFSNPGDPDYGWAIWDLTEKK
ncbi:S41 family peptidase [Desulfosporosinus sp. SB140]|uniref:S41 family peptidase n=1 Tax=Desulfosporosinus paludis TaxID=3115649 RepID=UPI00388F0C9B